MATYPVTVRILDQRSAGVQNVGVHVYDADNRFIQDSGFTDAAGEAAFAAIEEGVAYVRFYGTVPHATITSPQVIRVEPPPMTNIFEVEAVTPEAPRSKNPRACTCYGWFNRPDMVGRRLQLYIDSIEDPATVSNIGETGGPLIVDSDETGYFEFDLPQGGIYGFTVPGYENEVIIARVGIKTNDTPLTSVLITELLFPTPTTLVFDPAGPLTIAAGDSEELSDTRLTMSPGYYLDAATGAESGEETMSNITRYIEYTSSDDAVATVQALADGTPKIDALSAGAVTISARLRTDIRCWPHALPEPSLTVTPVTVTVA